MWHGGYWAIQMDGVFVHYADPQVLIVIQIPNSH